MLTSPRVGPGEPRQRAGQGRLPEASDHLTPRNITSQDNFYVSANHKPGDIERASGLPIFRYGKEHSSRGRRLMKHESPFANGRDPEGTATRRRSLRQGPPLRRRQLATLVGHSACAESGYYRGPRDDGGCFDSPHRARGAGSTVWSAVMRVSYMPPGSTAP